MDGPRIVENLFFGVTCVSVFTCTVRCDYNFAMGLLSYYMIKNAGNKISSSARTVSSPNTETRPLASDADGVDHRDGSSVVRHHGLCLVW